MRKSDFHEIVRLSAELYEQYAESDFPTSYASVYQGLDKLFMSAPYLRVMTENSDIVGWFAAGNGTHQQLSYIKGMTQAYYHTSLTGIKAVKALIAFHDDFYKFAEQNGFQVVITSSALPTKQVFNRILERNGWHVSGDRLVRKTSHYPAEILPSAKLGPNPERVEIVPQVVVTGDVGRPELATQKHIRRLMQSVDTRRLVGTR
jgi:hypothetical protein